MSKPISQHWVPQFYLKQFATIETLNTKSPKVWIFSKDKQDGAPSLTNIKNICAKRHLYSPPHSDGQREWGLESKMARLESVLSTVLPSIANGYVDLMQPEIRKVVALFVSVMHLRHPDNLIDSTSLHQRMVQIYEKAPKKKDGTPEIDVIEINGKMHEINTSGWDEYRNWDKNDHHIFFVNMVHSTAIFLAEILLKKRWSMIFSKEAAFVTSDKPVGKQHKNKEMFGFATEGAIITFPCSPTHLLVMDDMHSELQGQYYPLHNNDPGPFNLLIWRNGSRFMISQRNIDEVLFEMIEWNDRYEMECL
ncbi:MAG: DUF4238 domain-containing protein [Desulfobaccales bacterium]